MLRRVSMLAVILCLGPVSAALGQCPGDVDGDGEVGINDFLAVLGQWGPGGGSADVDGDGSVGIQDFLIILGNWGPCPAPPPYPTPPAIVVYNLNYPDLDGTGVNDSREIAEYYVAARGLDPAALCGVRLPPGEYATPDELLGARRTIVENCICPVVSQDVQDGTGCDIANAGALESIRDASPITHMVLVKGIPIRLFALGWPDQAETDMQGPSFGFYLSYLVYHDADIFSDVALVEPLPYASATDAGLGYIGPLDPASHHMLAYGRVEAMTRERTVDLIDRTIAAERAGVKGNILLEDTDPFFYDLTSTHDSVCFDYLSHEPFVFGDPASSWPYQLCRVGSTASSSVDSDPGNIPGAAGTTVPYAVNAGVLHGRNSIPGFSGFGGFYNMLNWHTSDETCTELCRQLPTQQEQDDCRASSTDYFREINTDCVGVAGGFMAYQLSSFGVQYYGFTPPGWGLSKGSSFHKSMPRVLSGPAFDDGVQFTDDRYLHYGVYDHLTPDQSTCESGACPAHLPVVLATTVDIDDVFIGDSAKQHTLRFRYRYTESPGQPAATLFMRLRYFRDSGLHQDSALEMTSIVDSAGGWSTASRDFSIGPVANESVTAIRVRLWASADDNISGFLDLDGFELIDADTQANVMPVDVGSFTADQKETTEQGDWAANVIDRLGGIASWGTASHHTSGASTLGGRFPGALFAGRTLGEALAHANSVGPAGVIYGDPLYRPAAAKLYTTGFVPVYQHDHIGDRDGYDVWSDTYQPIDLTINVLHGTDNVNTTRWEILTCPEVGIGPCEGSWTSHRQGVGAVEGLSLGGLDSFIDLGQDQSLTVKLRVWNEGQEDADLTNYAYFRYWAHELPECPGDGNADGVVDVLDETALLLYWGPKWFCSQACPMVDGFCIADVNQDGQVDIQDWLIVLNSAGLCLIPLDCPADVNGDGIVDGLDLELVEQYWTWGATCPLPYEECPVDEDTGFCVYDLDLDGDVDEADHQALLNLTWGPCPF